MNAKKINAPLVIPQITDRKSLTQSLMNANLEYSGGSWMHKPQPRAEFVSAAAWAEIERLRRALTSIMKSTGRSAASLRTTAAAALAPTYPDKDPP